MQKRLLISLISLIFTCSFLPLGAETNAAVYARGETYVVGVTAPDLHTDDNRVFWNSFKDFVADTPEWPKTLPIVNPPEWGKTISMETHGQVDYTPHFEGGFVCHLSLSKLAPNTLYILTINGNPERAGNKLLPTPVPGNEEEFFYDFAFIESDENGNYNATLGVKLKTGEYDVRIYVKDTNDFKIVLIRDFFQFTVE